MPHQEEKNSPQNADESAPPGEGGIVTKLEALVVRAVIDPDDPLGLLPTGTQAADLPVFIENRWPVYAIEGITDTVRVYWSLSRTKVDSRRLDGPITEGQFPMEFTIPRNRLQSDGTFDIWYTVTNSFINLPTKSEVTKVTIDTRAPSYDKQLEALLPPDDLPGGVITEEYLFDNDDKVVFRLPLPRYTDAQNRDTGFLFWSENDPPTGAAVSSEVFLDVDGELTLTLSGDEIRAANKNGLFQASCKVRDRAGNESGFARSTPVMVSLRPSPVDLPAPTVPLHDDGLIHRADARTPVTIVIAHFDNPEPGDEVVFRWDGTDLLPPKPVVFPVTAEVPWAALIKNGPGPRTVQVSYRVLRNGGSIPSLSTPININLAVAGQDHPGAPALLNPLLALPDVYGQSAIRNTLIPSDKGHPVIPVVVLYHDPVEGERLEFHWGNWPGAVASYTVKFGDAAGMPVSFSAVPWEVIEAEPNNSRLPVYYTTSNGVNQQQSQNQFVNVQIVTIDDLREPSFPGADIFGYINCGSEEKPWDGIRVRVTFINDRFDASDEIKLFWQGHEYLSPETPPIPETFGTFDQTVDASHIAQGFVDITVKPYEPYIRPIREGAGNAWYTLSKSDGQFGRSKPDFVKIVRKQGGGEDCEPPDGWEPS